MNEVIFMAITISTHNGSTLSIKHNLREKELISKENVRWANRHNGELRFDPKGSHEILYHEDLREVYHKLFDESVAKWNLKQIKEGHRERCIDDYLKYIRAKEGSSKKAKHPVYEIIYTVGSMDNPVDREISEKILREIVETFKDRNPNLYLLGAYLHQDERGADHVHLDYIPVAYNSSRGPEIQTGLKQALKEQGIEGTGYRDTAQMRWERRENETLEHICNRFGLEVKHPQRDQNLEHLTVEEYRTIKKLADKQKELEKLQQLPGGIIIVPKGRIKQLEDIEKAYAKIMADTEKSQRDTIAARAALEKYAVMFSELERKQQAIDLEINREANRKVKSYRDEMRQFMVARGLLPEFERYQNELQQSMEQVLG